MSKRILIYGATGFTGTALVARALECGLRPIIAGRNAGALRQMAEHFDLPFRCAEVRDATELRLASGVELVLNAAGPFSATAVPILESCLAEGAHYVDVCGELGVFKALSARHAEAHTRGIALLPGAGLLVCASDCLAMHLARMLDGIHSLKLGIARPTLLRRGSLKTIATIVDDHIEVRNGGVLERRPVGARGSIFDFGSGEVWCTSVSGAELVACYHSTGAPNIEVFMPAGAAERLMHRWAARLTPVIQSPIATALLHGVLDHSVSPEPENGSPQVVVGLAEDRAGRRVCARLTTPEPYQATAIFALALVERLLCIPTTGFITPSALYGISDMLGTPGFACDQLDAAKL